MSKYNQLEEHAKKDIIVFCQHRHDALLSVYLGCYERFIKAFSVISTGGIIGTLTYVLSRKNPERSIWLSLDLFIISVFILFIILAIDFFTHAALRKTFSSISDKVFKGEIETITLYKTPKWYTNTTIFLWILGLANILVILGGIIFGAIGINK